MNNKTNYTIVGLFVIAGFVAIGIFFLWLAKPSDEEEMKKYTIYFNESVLGLNLNSPVKYRGIDVGKVVYLGINPKNSTQVKVIISVKKDTPIKTTTAAKLTSQGITGLSYINLLLGDQNAPLLTKAPKGEEYPVIKSIPSFFESFQTSFGNFYNKVTKTLDHVDELLDKGNQQKLSRLLDESGEFFARLNKTLSDETIQNFHDTMQYLKVTSQELEKTIPKVQTLVESTKVWEDQIAKSLDTITNSYLEMQKTMDAIGDSVRRGDFNIRAITDDFMPSLNSSLSSLNRLLIKLDEVLDKYEKSPRSMILKEQEIRYAPGEK